MRDTTAFKRLMDLPGVTVSKVDFQDAAVVVTVKLRSKRLCCPECGFSTKARYDVRPVLSEWRHLDLCAWRLEVRAELRRISCPEHGVRTEGVPFARPGARFTRDFEDLVGWLATRMGTLSVGLYYFAGLMLLGAVAILAAGAPPRKSVGVSMSNRSEPAPAAD